MPSTAYDLSIYEPKPKRPQEEKPRVKVVAEHSREELARPKMAAKAVFLVALMTVSLCLLLYSNAVLTELSDQVAEATARYEKLEAQLKRRATKAASGAKAQDKPQGKDAEGAQA